APAAPILPRPRRLPSPRPRTRGSGAGPLLFLPSPPLRGRGAGGEGVWERPAPHPQPLSPAGRGVGGEGPGTRDAEGGMAADERLDVLAAAAPPDDLEITCGGTLAKLARQGYRVGMLDLTTGEPTPRGSPETRAREAEAARRVLGVQLRRNLGLPNRELMDTPANRYAVATQFRRLRPTVVLVPAGRTPAASPDHHQAHLLVEAARFYSQLTKWDDRFGGTGPYRVPHLVYAPFAFDAEVRHWQGTFVVDITDTFEQKLEALRCYASQF